MHDAHFHMTDTLWHRLKALGMSGIANASSPEEFSLLQQLRREHPFFISCGIHPWDADRFTPDEMLPYMERADFIGEIGLDNIWCNTDLDIQRDIFRRQLEYAMEKQKPVILHTKGMEREVLDFLKRYPNRYLVHWYSCSDFLQEYIDLDCYFTIGPSVDRDVSVQDVARKVPFDRILLESDGIEAMAWAKSCAPQEVEYRSVMQASLEAIAGIRGTDALSLERQMDSNFQSFVRR